MKKLLILSVTLLISFLSNAQNKLYVELDGGQRSVLNMGKIGFNHYYFSNSSEKCDTLRCSESGLSDAEIEQYEIFTDSQKEMYQIFNKAIRKSIRAMEKKGKTTGDLNLMVKGKAVEVKYYDYQNPGSLKMEITII